MNGNPLIYLASPYSHADAAIKELRHRQVCLAAAHLIARGVTVFSPVAHSHPIALHGKAQGDWATWEKQCLALLDRCDLMLVLMLEGWRESTGIKAEALHCLHTGKDVLYTDPVSLPLFDFTHIDVATGQPARLVMARAKHPEPCERTINLKYSIEQMPWPSTTSNPTLTRLQATP